MSECFSSPFGLLSRFMRIEGDVGKAGHSEGGPGYSVSWSIPSRVLFSRTKAVLVALLFGLFHPALFFTNESSCIHGMEAWVNHLRLRSIVSSTPTNWCIMEECIRVRSKIQNEK